MIRTVISKCVERNVQFLWWVTGDTTPSDFSSRLESHGFTSIGNYAGMAVDLHTMKDAICVPGNFRISEISHAADTEIWSRISASVFGMLEHVSPTFSQWSRLLKKGGFPVALYLGWLEDEPVATSMAVYAEGVVGIYFVTTVESVRNRGIGRAMTLQPLLDAREKGFRVGVLEASEMAEPVYREIGFREYSRIAYYFWISPSHRT